MISTRDLASRIRHDEVADSPFLAAADQAEFAAEEHERPAGLSGEFVAPSSETEKSVARIWRQLLGLKEIGTHDDFFELGGHSLLATQFLSRLRREFHVDLPIQTLFEKPTIADMSEQIDNLLWARKGGEVSFEAGGEVVEGGI